MCEFRLCSFSSSCPISTLVQTQHKGRSTYGVGVPTGWAHYRSCEYSFTRNPMAGPRFPPVHVALPPPDLGPCPSITASIEKLQVTADSDGLGVIVTCVVPEMILGQPPPSASPATLVASCWTSSLRHCLETPKAFHSEGWQTCEATLIRGHMHIADECSARSARLASTAVAAAEPSMVGAPVPKVRRCLRFGKPCVSEQCLSRL